MNEEEKVLWRKLRCHSLLDLALWLPVRYEDRRLSERLEEGKEIIVEAEVREAGWHNGRFRVLFYLPRFSVKIASLFFQSSSYHLRTFHPGARLYIKGRLRRHGAFWQLPQPQVVQEVGTLIPKYKSPIAQEKLRALIEKYLSIDALCKEGIGASDAALLYGLHFPQVGRIPIVEGAWRPEILRRLKFLEALSYMRKLHKKRFDFPAVAALSGEIERFVEALPFTLTQAQQEAIETIRSDLSKEARAARRLIVGDVGAGKTMVILAAALTALPHKSILMAPTSLLAMQLYEEAQKHLGDLMCIALVTQNHKEGDIDEADFIIGTHALLYLKRLPEAALVMTDEQHRFGSSQRHALEKLVSRGERRPHYLQFSATPIPRTQAMIESAMIDVTLMRGLPFKKRIETRIVGKEDFAALLHEIKATIARKEQALIVYPLVEESEEVPYQSIEEGRNFWEARFEHVYVTHGKDKEKEEVLLAFRERGSILLATTVIEVGISLPRLTTIVIVGAERLGLATLHQLRGRVGRHGQQSRCYLYTHHKENLRLKAFAETTDGFEIAKLDLQFRNSGDILEGTIQSGVKFRWLDLAADEEAIEEAKQALNKSA